MRIRILCLILAFMSVLTLAGCGKKYEDMEYSISEADVFYHVPDLRQYEDYSSGAACVQMIMNYLEPSEYDNDISEYMDELDTDENNGTSVQNIKAYFDDNDVEFTENSSFTTDYLVRLLKDKNIILMCLQAWSKDGTYNTDDAESDDYLEDGHWVICVGYKKEDDTRIFYFNDPACAGYTVLEESDLNERWAYTDDSEQVFSRYGIVIGCSEDYNPSEAYYMK